MDFAVPNANMQSIRARLAAKNITVRPLSIGGIAVREGEVRIDFIDCSVDYADLFVTAVGESQANQRVVEWGDWSVPVVSPEYLIVLKVATAEDDDERDIESLAQSCRELDMRRARELARQHLDPVAAHRLDAIARRVGHPEARPRYRT